LCCCARRPEERCGFFLTFSVEPGFVEGVQFAPSLVGDERCRQVEWVAEALADPESVVRAEVLQSDEGGRFANSIARYQIVEAAAGWGESDVPDGDGRWMTLAQLKAMDRSLRVADKRNAQRAIAAPGVGLTSGGTDESGTPVDELTRTGMPLVLLVATAQQEDHEQHRRWDAHEPQEHVARRTLFLASSVRKFDRSESS
jgi:hypothetical protein